MTDAELDYEMTDEMLLAAVNDDGDRGALGILFARNREYFVRLAHRFEGPASSAEDIVSESITKLLARLDAGQLGHIDSFRPYFARTMHNAGIDMERRVTHESSADVIDLDSHHIVDDSSELLAESELVNSAFASLPDNWRQVLWHVEVVGETPDEASERLGISKGALAILKFRAREGLRQAYLAEHVALTADPGCRPVLAILPRYVRGKVSGARLRDVEAHLAGCATCSLTAERLQQMSSSMSGVLAPAAGVVGAAEPARRASAGAITPGIRRVLVLAAAVAAAGVVAVVVHRFWPEKDRAPAAPAPAAFTHPAAPHRSWTVQHRSPTWSPRTGGVSPTRSASAPAISPSAPVPAAPLPRPTPASAPPRPLLTAPSTTVDHRATGSIVHMAVDVTGPGAQQAVVVLSGGRLARSAIADSVAWRCSTERGVPNVRVRCEHRPGASTRFAADLTMAPDVSQITATIRLPATGQSYSILTHQ